MKDNKYKSLEMAYIKNLASINKCNQDKKDIITHIQQEEDRYARKK